jgi:hypothetical protein
MTRDEYNKLSEFADSITEEFTRISLKKLISTLYMNPVRVPALFKPFENNEQRITGN